MKYLAGLLVLIFSLPATCSEICCGSVFYLDFSQDEITISADSRGTSSLGSHFDTDCKISAFGDKFVFVFVGAVRSDGWDAHTVARQVWEVDSKSVSDATELVHMVYKDWVTKMEAIYRRPEVLSRLKEPTIANAAFAATDQAGNLFAVGVNITRSLDSNGTKHVSHNGNEILPTRSISGGRDEVLTEFLDRTSPRAKDYLAEFIPRISLLPPHERRAAFASKLIEWSIQLNPHQSDLGFPIDVLQLRRTSGVHWVTLKKNCARQ
jgi:hypothetical protein